VVQELMVELESGERRTGRIANRLLAVEWSPGREGLRVTGEVDLATREVWADVLAALLGGDTSGRLDLSGLSFIDVQGTVALTDVARRMPPPRNLTLYRPPVSLRRALDLFWSSDTPVIVIEDEDVR
jgi:ABC-type transporter Mla MlaB component